MSNITELSFNKRISTCKKEVFEGVTSSGELSNISGTTSTGYYSLETIYSYLYTSLEKNDLDLDILVCKGEYLAAWTDCQGNSEKVKSIAIDFSELVNIPKLPLMQNIIQSKGAEMSYKRRYALTAVLGLPATDKIDSQPAGNNNSTPPPKQQPKPESVSVDSIELKRLKNILFIVAKKDENIMIDMLEKSTEFTNKDGKFIKGVRDFSRLSKGRLDATLKDAIKKYPDIYKSIIEKEKKKKE